jgi:uncharacterized cupin superfamily protein
MPKIDLSKIPLKAGSDYPAPYAAEMAGRSSQRLGDSAGLTQFGVNITILAPGAKSSLRHWHEQQDEFLIVIAGNLTLVDDNGATPLGAGDCAAFPAGDANGHHIVNRSGSEGRFLVVGQRTDTEVAHYSDVDMRVEMTAGKYAFTRRDGTPLPKTET